MQLLIISGFLGSGKTTLLLDIAKYLADQGRKIAIIENEVGEVGVDDHFLSENDLPVKEIYSGCICCSLRLDLISSLMTLERQYDPDIVILEPSGVASPTMVLQALIGYGGGIFEKRFLSIVDASRFDKFEDLSIPLVKDGISCADLTIVNKKDLVSEKRLKEIETKIATLTSPEGIVSISGLNRDEVISIAERINSDVIPVGNKEVPAHPLEKKGPPPRTFALEKELTLTEKYDKERLTTALDNYLKELAEELEKSGCSMIGHLKTIVKSPKGGYLLASITDFNTDAQIKGMLPPSTEEIKIICNAIVFGVTPEILESLVKDKFAQLEQSIITQGD